MQMSLIKSLTENSREVLLEVLDKDGNISQLTGSDIIGHAMRSATVMLNRGIKPGDKVLFCASHSPVFLTTLIGCLITGIVPVVFAHPSPKTGDDQYKNMVKILSEQLNPNLIIVDPKFEMQLEDVNFPKLSLANFTEMRAPKPRDQIDRFQDLERTVVIQYSSGTTGLKKGVILTERALLSQVEHYAEAIQLTRDDTIVSWLPLYHDMGLIACFILPLLRGIPIVLMSPFDWVNKPEILLNAIERNRATLTWLPNFAYSFLARRFKTRDLDNYDLSSLRMVINCSEPITHDSQAEFLATFSKYGVHQNALASSYAMAETTFAITQTRPSAGQSHLLVDLKTLTVGAPVDEGSDILISSGSTIEGTSLKIIGENDEVLPDGHLGEISVQSKSLMKGYLGKDTFSPDLDYKTGDLGFMRDGDLYVVGRKDDMIIVAGQNLHPHLIEEVVSSVDGVVPGRCVAFGADTKNLGTNELVILAEVKRLEAENQPKIIKEIRQALAARIELAPAYIELCEHMTLSKSTSGKISRKANRNWFLEKIENSNLTSQPELDEASDFAGQLTRFIRDTYFNSQSIPDGISFITDGYIDSLGLAQLWVFLEETLQRSVPSPVDAGLDKFNSIETIIRFVDQLDDPSDPHKAASAISFTQAKIDLYNKSGKEADFLLLGSSTSGNCRTIELQNLGFTPFNMSITSGTLFDFYALLRYAIDNNNKKLRHVMIGLDLDRISQAFPSPALKHNKILRDYLAEAGLDTFIIDETKNRAEKTNITDKNRAKILHGWDAMQLEDWAPWKEEQTLNSVGDTITIRDGVTLDRFEMEKDLGDAEFAGIVIRTKKKTLNVYQLVFSCISEIDKLAYQHDIKLDVFFPPVHNTVLDQIEQLENYKSAVKTIKDIFQNLGRENLRVFDFRRVKEFGGVLSDFRDPMHPGPLNGRKMFEIMFSQQK